MFHATPSLAANFKLYSPDTTGVLFIILKNTLTFISLLQGILIFAGKMC
jgi:hypothetical protein